MTWGDAESAGSLFWGSPLQNKLAEKAVNDLAAVYGTEYTYGSIANTICKQPYPKTSWPTLQHGQRSVLESHFPSSPYRPGSWHHCRLGL